MGFNDDKSKIIDKGFQPPVSKSKGLTLQIPPLFLMNKNIRPIILFIGNGLYRIFSSNGGISANIDNDIIIHRC